MASVNAGAVSWRLAGARWRRIGLLLGLWALSMPGVSQQDARSSGRSCQPMPAEQVERMVARENTEARARGEWSLDKQWYIRARAQCHFSVLGALLDNVVMLETEIEGEPSIGAGIVTGARQGQLVIATANHVVRRGTTAARRVTLRFRTWPDQPVRGLVLPFHDALLDLAAVAVPLAETTAAGGPDLVGRYVNVRLPEYAFGESFYFDNNRYALASDAPSRGTVVAAVGQPGGRRWFAPQQTARVDRVSDDDISFEQQFLTPGYSGGALVGPDGLLGMIRSDAPPFGSALPMLRIRRAFRDAGLPFVLRPYDSVYEERKTCHRPPDPRRGEPWPSSPFVIDCGDNTGESTRLPPAGWVRGR